MPASRLAAPSRHVGPPGHLSLGDAGGPRSSTVRAHASSGTSGKPTIVAVDLQLQLLTDLQADGLSEVIGPGVAMECAASPGSLHVFDDHFLPEVLDPSTGERVPDGQRGELALTTITKEAQPIVRHRTGDMISLQRGTCGWGRTHPRIARVEGRTDDMLIIRGVNVFPREFETVILEAEELKGADAMVVDRRETLVALQIHAEVAATVPAGLAARLAETLTSRLRVTPRGHVASTGHAAPDHRSARSHASTTGTTRPTHWE